MVLHKFPEPIKQPLRLLRRAFRMATSPLRLLPCCLIIGAQRAGTMSMFRYLSNHPQIRPSLLKEIHYFDINYYKNVQYYRSFFPMWLFTNRFKTLEASPYYMIHPHSAKRAFELIPDAKLIVLVRDPVQRAFSHYQHNVRQGYETLSFEDAINTEEERINDELERLKSDDQYYSFNYRHYSYVLRGQYIDHIMAWLKYFPREQMLITHTEEMGRDPASVYEQTLKFLNLPPFQLNSFNRYHSGTYLPPHLDTVKKLRSYFRPYNTKLFQFLGQELDWS